MDRVGSPFVSLNRRQRTRRRHPGDEAAHRVIQENGKFARDNDQKDITRTRKREMILNLVFVCQQLGYSLTCGSLALFYFNRDEFRTLRSRIQKINKQRLALRSLKSRTANCLS